MSVSGARRFGRVVVAAALAVSFLGMSPAAVAYQVPATAFAQQGSTAAVGTMPSSLTQTITTAGQTVTSAATTAGSRGANTATYNPQLPGSTPAQEITVRTGDCKSTGICTNRGIWSITFSQPVTNPTLHISGIGGVTTETSGGKPTKQSELHAIFKLTTTGVTLSKASTGNNFELSGSTITAVDDDTSPSCSSTNTTGSPSKATAACGSVLVVGTVTTLTFEASAIFTKNASLPAHNQPTSGDAVTIVASVNEDFGDLPASYDGGNAARAVVGPLKLGGAVSVDNASVANATTSPNASGTDANDDGVTLTPLVTTATSYSTTVQISGASKAGQVCGWIDFNKNGTFDSGERACAAVAAGQTSATLTWSGLTGLSAGSTYARFRVGYTGSQVQSPIGASDSGEVEDYPFTIKLPDPPAATADTDSTPQDVNVTVNPLSNDKASVGAALVPTSVVLRDPADGTFKKSVTIPGEGSYTVNADGTVTFDPLPGFTGTAAPVTYRITDNTGQTATSTITITVTPVKPDAVDDTNTTPYDTNVTTPVLTNDKPGHASAPLVPSSVCIVSGASCEKTHMVPGEGTYTVNADGTIGFDPLPGFAGKTTPITYQVADDNGTTSTAKLTITVQPPPAPAAQPDTETTPQNVDVTVKPLTNDSAGAPGITLDAGSVVLRDPADGVFKKTVTIPGEGSYTVNPDGTVTFDPVPAFTGTATSLGYRIADSTGQTAESTITITVTPVQPQAVSDSRTTPFNTPTTIDVLGNDKPGRTDTPLVPGSVRLIDPATGQPVSTLTVPNQGSYAVNPDGTVKFTPVDGFQGTTTSVTYQVADSNGTPTRAQITVSVEAPAPPVANPDNDTTPQGKPVTTGVLGNDKPGPTGAALDPSTVKLIDPVTGQPVTTLTVPNEGSYTVNPDGTVKFEPLPGFVGTTTPVKYQVADGNKAVASSELTIVVTPVTPDAENDAATTPYDTTVKLRVLDNDKPGAADTPLVPGSVKLIDPVSGQPVNAVTVPNEGTFTVQPDGTVDFDPLPTFTGQTTPLTYQVADSNGTLAKATITVTVAKPPAPTAQPDTGTTPQDVNITVNPLANDSAGTGTTLDPLSVALIDPNTGQPVKTLTVPNQGSYTVNPDGTVSFDPVPAFTGPATPVSYQVKDALGQPVTSTITITVTPITPAAEDDSGKTPHDTPITVPVLANDKAGDPSAPLVPSSVLIRDPADGSYKPSVTVPGEGSYTVKPDGSISFDPLPTFSGVTTPVTYRVADDNGSTDIATLIIAVGEAPQAKPDTGTTPQDVNITVKPLDNDAAGTGASLDPASVALIDSTTGQPVKTLTVPNEGTYTVNPDGTVSFDPVPTFTGQATPVKYQVKDSNGSPATATIAITVTPITPSAIDDAATTPFNTNVTVPVLGNDKPGDPSAPLDPATVELRDPADGTFKTTVTIPNEGTYTVQPDGTVSFDPVDGFHGVTTPITYRVKDDNGTPDDAQLTITVGDAPAANPNTATTKQNVTVTVDPLDNDKPGTGGTLDPTSVQVFDQTTQTWGKTVTVPGQGTYTVRPDGTVSFDPEPGFTGDSSVPYRVTDSHGNSAASTVTITVQPITPDAMDDHANTPFNTPVTVSVVANDKPGDPSAPLVPSSVTLLDPSTGQPVSTLTVPGEGTYAVNPDGTVKFTPVNGFKGTTTPVTYQLNDSNGTPAKAELTVTVGDRPQAFPDSATTPQGQQVNLPVLANDKPGTGATLDPATVRLIDPKTGDPVLRLTVPGEGLWIVHPDGTITFRPEPDFTGSTTPVGYLVKDGNGNPARSTATVTVTPVTPDAVNDAGSTPYRTPVTVDLLGNDKPGAANTPLVPSSVLLRDPADGKFKKTVTIPDEGTYTVRPDGSVRFVPADGFSGGTTPVTYRVADSNGTPATAQLVITVGEPGGASAKPDSGTGRPGKPVLVNPLANDKPSDGATWRPGTVCLVTSSGACVKKVVVPNVGTWTVNQDGTIKFVSDPDFTGTAKIPYRVTDSHGVTVDSTVKVTIASGATPPKPGDDDDDLPDTGGPLAPVLLIGALLVAIGGALAAIARRRRRK